MKRYYLDLFHGIGGFALGAYWAGMTFDAHYCSDIEPYAVARYAELFPQSTQLGDVTKINYERLPYGEWIITGGFPCQPHSVAGARKASEDERDLWSECVRAIRGIRPRFAVFENVRGLLTSERGEFFNRVLTEIHESGYACEWEIISASDIGAPHRRERIWIVCYPQGTMGNTKEIGFDNRDDCAYERETVRKIDTPHGASLCVNVAHSDENRKSRLPIDANAGQRKLFHDTFKIERKRCPEKQICRKQIISQQPIGSGAHMRNGRATQSRLDGIAYGIPGWMDGTWELGIPRITRKKENRSKRIAAIGNAIVPQIAHLLFARIKELL